MVRGKQSPLAAEIGARLRRIRQQNGWTQTALAERIGMKRPQLYRYEAGLDLPNVETIVLICDTLEVKVDDLLRGPQVPADPIMDVELRECLRIAERLPSAHRATMIDMLHAIFAKAESERAMGVEDARGGEGK